MKCSPRALLALICSACWLWAQGSLKAEVRIDLDQPASAPAARANKASPSQPAKPPTSVTPAAPAKSGATSAASKSKKKKDEPPPQIDGLEISRGDHGYLGVKIEGGVFKITFYDQKKKPVDADVSGAVLRWPVHYQPNDERDSLSTASDGKSLTSGKIVRPPYSFKLFITLLKKDASGQDLPGDTYVVDFHQ